MGKSLDELVGLAPVTEPAPARKSHKPACNCAACKKRRAAEADASPAPETNSANQAWRDATSPNEDDDQNTEPLSREEKDALRRAAEKNFKFVHACLKRKWRDDRWDLSKEELAEYSEEALPLMERHPIAEKILAGNIYLRFAATVYTIEDNHAIPILREQGVFKRPDRDQNDDPDDAGVPIEESPRSSVMDKVSLMARRGRAA